MEQKDYFLREIEKIGSLLKAIFSKISKNTGETSISVEKQFEETKNELFESFDFDLLEFINLKNEEVINYLENKTGLNVVNIELLSSILEKLGLNDKSERKKHLFEKSLLTIEYCKNKDKTFSFERDDRIERLKSFLQ
jgi:hypothetical protein